MHVLANTTSVCFAPKPTRTVGFSSVLPKGGSSPGSLQITLRFAVHAGWNCAQSESRGTAHNIRTAGIQNTEYYFLQRSNLSPCLYWASERTVPSLLEALPAAVSIPCQMPRQPPHLSSACMWNPGRQQGCVLSSPSMKTLDPKYPTLDRQICVGVF